MSFPFIAIENTFKWPPSLEWELGPFDEGGKEGVRRRGKEEKKVVVKSPVLLKSQEGNSPGNSMILYCSSLINVC